jgi:transposase-like protein
MDEAGNTGENLLDPDQPIYALAALRMDDEKVHRAVGDALGRTQMSELKFQRLRTSNAGRQNILTLLGELDLSPETVTVMVVHKPWMLAAKLVDELIEPRMLAKGLQMGWYATGAAKRMADALFALAPRTLGDLYADLQTAFVGLLRDYSQENATAFLTALRRSRIVCANGQMSDLLAVMIDTPAQLEEEFASGEDALDPALTALYCQAGHWSSSLAEPFEVVHDDSNMVRRWREQFEVMRVAAERGRQRTGQPARPQSLIAGEIEIELPTMLQNISFVTSEHDERVQLADLLAGSAAHVYAVATGAKTPDRLARDLERAGVGDLIFNAVGPGADATPARAQSS